MTLTWIQIAQTVEHLVQQGSRSERTAAYQEAAATFQVAAPTAKRAANAYRFAKEMARSASIPISEIKCTMTAAEEMRNLARLDANQATYLSARFLLGKLNVAEIRRVNEHYRNIHFLKTSDVGRIERSSTPWVEALDLAKRNTVAVDGFPFENELTRIIGCDVATMDENGNPWVSLHLSPLISTARFFDHALSEVGRSALAAAAVFRNIKVLLVNVHEKRFLEKISGKQKIDIAIVTP